MNKKKGFTLIELMLVVIIISALAAMVLPRLAGRSEQARVAAANADIRANIATALKLYELDNGQFALYPNNRTRIFDNSLTPETPKVPEFKVSTVYYQVENGHDRDGLGNDENYFWKTAKERKNTDQIPDY